MKIKKPLIAISAPGKFDLFRWAEGFQSQGLLHRLLTDFYSRKLPILSWKRKDIEEISPNKVKIFPWPRLARPAIKKILPNYGYYENVLFDRWASQQVADSDIIITRSSCALATLTKAKQKNQKTILYRGSSHIEYQQNTLKAERDKWGLPLQNPIPQEYIDRELKEYNLCDYLFVPSSYAAATYKNKGLPPEKIIHFPLSVERKSEANSKQSPQNKKFQVLFVGALSLAKGLPYLLETAKILKDRQNINFKIIGAPTKEIQPFLKKYSDCCNFIGAVKHHLIDKHYNQASVLVLPSIDDGFGQVILEAMTRGLPVIATDRTGAPDIIDNNENGFVIPARDTRALSQKILQLCQEPWLANKIGQNAKQKSERYSIQNFIKNWTNFFQTVDWL